MSTESFADHFWIRHAGSRHARVDREDPQPTDPRPTDPLGLAAFRRHHQAIRHLAQHGGPFGPGGGSGRFGPGGGGGPRFGGGRGRKRRGDVRVALLLLLAEEPRNGYQLMQEIEERSGGRWRPSPGSVYPTLQQLEDQGLVRPVEREGTKLFEITEAGSKHLAESGVQTPWEADAHTESFRDLKAQIKQIAVAAAQVMHAGDEQQVKRASEVLTEARKSLYRILADGPDA